MEYSLPLVETFHSLQGEGAHAGRSAYFIRTAGCKVGCKWCDTKESWVTGNHPKQSVQKLILGVSQAISNGAGFIVITGGEPLHHNLDPLCEAIRKLQSIPIHLETSGVNQLSGNPDWITLSPKRHLPPSMEIMRSCQEIKFIIHEEKDIIFAQEIATQAQKINTKNPYLYMQPGWNNSRGKELVVKFIIKNPEWRMSVQTHKWLNIN